MMREEQIFHEALEQAAEQRAAFLAAACGADLELRQRVEVLLQAQANPGSFLQSPAPGIGNAPTSSPSSDEMTGTQIGPYKLLQQIGEGGMGTVYMAEQTQPVQRKVALKVIKAGMDSRQIIARFEAERQALAMMDHVNIARVLDAGATDAGRPYFVMELVHGVPITKYCDDNRLTPRERLELFVPVCQAIQHAHQKGVIHRDIKPSNVMITLYDGKPVPKVIDFGVAKATEQKLTERTLFTQYGTMVGTLEYMSPEQAEMSALGVDTRSDIYSLGVLLYELLTGNTPLRHKRMKEAAFAEILRLIKEEEPPRPSTRLSDPEEALASISAQRHTEPAKLSKLMRGELDWIVMKTLEKDRNRRYETANGLAMDVQRYLHDETVQACPPSAGYRLRKFVRRYKGPVLATSFILLCLIGGIIGTTLGLVEAKLQERIAVDERDRALKAETQANANFRQAREAVDDMYTQVAEKWLAQQPHLEVVQREFLQKALRFYEQFAKEAGSDAATRFERARAYRRVAEIQFRLGARAQAEPAGHRAIDLLEKLSEEFPAVPEYRQELGNTLQNWGALLASAGRNSEREKVIRRALAIQEKLVADFPRVPDYRNDLGRGKSRLGELLGSLRQSSEAAKAYRSALAIQNPLVGEFPSNPEYRYELADSYFLLGNTLRSMGQSQESQKALGQAATILEKLATDSPNVPEYRNVLAGVYNSLAYLFPSNEAEQWVGKAIILQEKLAADFPGHTDYRYDLFRSLETRGSQWQHAERRKDAEQAFRRAVEIGEKLAAESPTVHYYRSRLASCYRGLADLLGHAGNLSEAEAHYQHSIRLYEHLIAEFPDIPDMREQVVPSYQSLAQLLVSAGRQQEAVKVYRQAIASLERPAAANPRLPAYRRELAQLYNRQGILLRNADRKQEADVLLRKAQELWQANLDPAIEQAKKAAEAKPEDGHRWHELFVAYYNGGDWENCLRAIKKKQEIFEASAWEWFHEAMAHWQLGHNSDARKCFFQAIGWMEEAQELRLRDFQSQAAALLGLPDPRVRSQKASSYFSEGNAYQQQGQMDKAKAAYGQAIVSYESLVADLPMVAAYRMKLIDLLTKTGRPADAEKAYEQVLQMQKKRIVDFPDKPDYRNELADFYLRRGDRLAVSGKPKEAEQAFRQSFTIKAKLAADFSNRPDLYSLQLGDVLWAAQRRQGSEKTIRLFIELCEGLVAQVPNAPEFQKELARCHNHLGLVLAGAGRLQEAEQAHRRALQVQRQALELCLKLAPKKDEHHRRELAWTSRNLGHVLNRRHQPKDAEAAYRQALALCQKLHTDFPADEIYRNWIAENYESLALLLMVSGRAEEADTLFRKLLELKPNNAPAHNNLAWVLAMSPDPKSRDAGRAVKLAKKAVELAPSEGNYWNTLGAAHYQASNWNAAIAALEKSGELRKGGDSFDWFFLAMAHWQREEKEEARRWYDRALAWMEKNKPNDEELRRFQGEAAKLLKIETQSKPVPKSK